MISANDNGSSPVGGGSISSNDEGVIYSGKKPKQGDLVRTISVPVVLTMRVSGEDPMDAVRVAEDFLAESPSCSIAGAEVKITGIIAPAVM